MSYQEKRTLTMLLTGAAVFAAYCVYAFNKLNAGVANLTDLRFWATTMLIFIGIGIGAVIVIQIIFHILLSISIAVKEAMRNQKVDDRELEKNIKLEMVEDEMDKLIEMKSNQVGFAVAGIGFVAGLITLIVGVTPVVMLNILFASFNLGSILGGAVQIYYYRRGVQHA